MRCPVYHCGDVGISHALPRGCSGHRNASLWDGCGHPRLEHPVCWTSTATRMSGHALHCPGMATGMFRHLVHCPGTAMGMLGHLVHRLGTAMRVLGHLVHCPDTATGMLRAPCASPQRGHKGARGTWCVALAWPWRCSGHPMHCPAMAVGMPGHLTHYCSHDATAASPGASPAKTLSRSRRCCKPLVARAGSGSAGLFGTSPELYGSQSSGLPRCRFGGCIKASTSGNGSYCTGERRVCGRSRLSPRRSRGRSHTRRALGTHGTLAPCLLCSQPLEWPRAGSSYGSPAPTGPSCRCYPGSAKNLPGESTRRHWERDAGASLCVGRAWASSTAWHPV
ncbi:uncharacterized protein LOC129734174 [Falco cherrug]|uniref:uncharacterized protein LOC129734174 n=1 Tax=Falco cherrug TaxID=345164 RepID=UPI0024796B62|nr:uncharacterized protein LOC129734174 [Falco cherrug]